MRKNNYDSRLLISRSRQIALLLLVGVVTVTFTLSIFKAQMHNVPWVFLITPILGIGSFFLIFPATEGWEYRPWQGKARKIEQHFQR